MRNGFSLVELVFALLVFQVGMLGTAALVFLAQRSMLRAELTVRAVLETSWVADSLSRSGEAGAGTLDYPWGRLSWARSADRLGGIEVVAVSPEGRDTLAVARGWDARVTPADSGTGTTPGVDPEP